MQRQGLLTEKHAADIRSGIKRFFKGPNPFDEFSYEDIKRFPFYTLDPKQQAFFDEARLRLLRADRSRFADYKKHLSFLNKVNADNVARDQKAIKDDLRLQQEAIQQAHVDTATNRMHNLGQDALLATGGIGAGLYGGKKLYDSMRKQSSAEIAEKVAVSVGGKRLQAAKDFFTTSFNSLDRYLAGQHTPEELKAFYVKVRKEAEATGAKTHPELQPLYESLLGKFQEAKKFVDANPVPIKKPEAPKQPNRPSSPSKPSKTSKPSSSSKPNLKTKPSSATSRAPRGSAPAPKWPLRTAIGLLGLGGVTGAGLLGRHLYKEHEAEKMLKESAEYGNYPLLNLSTDGERIEALLAAARKKLEQLPLEQVVGFDVASNKPFTHMTDPHYDMEQLLRSVPDLDTSHPIISEHNKALKEFHTRRKAEYLANPEIAAINAKKFEDHQRYLKDVEQAGLRAEARAKAKAQPEKPPKAPKAPKEPKTPSPTSTLKEDVAKTHVKPVDLSAKLEESKKQVKAKNKQEAHAVTREKLDNRAKQLSSPRTPAASSSPKAPKAPMSRLAKGGLIGGGLLGAGLGGYGLYRALKKESQEQPLTEEQIQVLRLASLTPEQRALYLQVNPAGVPKMATHKEAGFFDFFRGPIGRKSPEFSQGIKTIDEAAKNKKLEEYLAARAKSKGLNMAPTGELSPAAKPGFLQRNKWPLGLLAAGAGGLYLMNQNQDKYSAYDETLTQYGLGKLAAKLPPPIPFKAKSQAARQGKPFFTPAQAEHAKKLEGPAPAKAPWEDMKKVSQSFEQGYMDTLAQYKVAGAFARMLKGAPIHEGAAPSRYATGFGVKAEKAVKVPGVKDQAKGVAKDTAKKMQEGWGKMPTWGKGMVAGGAGLGLLGGGMGIGSAMSSPPPPVVIAK